MKNLFASVLFLSVFLFSCKNTSFIKQDVSTQDNKKQSTYTYSMEAEMQRLDIEYWKTKWTEEDKKEFVNEFVYEYVVYNGDTIR